MEREREKGKKSERNNKTLPVFFLSFFARFRVLSLSPFFTKDLTLHLSCARKRNQGTEPRKRRSVGGKRERGRRKGEKKKSPLMFSLPLFSLSFTLSLSLHSKKNRTERKAGRKKKRNKQVVVVVGRGSGKRAQVQSEEGGKQFFFSFHGKKVG